MYIQSLLVNKDTHALWSYGRAIPRDIGPPQGRCVFSFARNPCKP